MPQTLSSDKNSAERLGRLAEYSLFVFHGVIVGRVRRSVHLLVCARTSFLFLRRTCVSAVVGLVSTWLLRGLSLDQNPCLLLLLAKCEWYAQVRQGSVPIDGFVGIV